MPFVEAMELVEQVAAVDGSTGWCMMVEGVMGASLGSFLPPDGARTVFPTAPTWPWRATALPRGFARPVDGGYQIRGHWAYGSCIFTPNGSIRLLRHGRRQDEAQPGRRTRDRALPPSAQLDRAQKGNWDVLGLRGTGSYDYTLKEPELFRCRRT